MILKKNLEKEKKKIATLQEHSTALQTEIDSVNLHYKQLQVDSKNEIAAAKKAAFDAKAEVKAAAQAQAKESAHKQIDDAADDGESNANAGERDEVADLPDSFTLDDLNMDYDEESLASVCECRGRIMLKLETLDSLLDKPVNMRNQTFHKQREALMQIEDEMLGEITTFGVEPCAALRFQLDRTFLKRKTMNAWKGMLGNNNDTEDKSMLELPNQLASLALAIESGGGWRAALYLDSGDINLHCVIANWSMKDQVEMLLDIRAFLEVDWKMSKEEVSTLELNRNIDKEKIEKLESDLKALRKSSKAAMMKARKEKSGGAAGGITIEKLNEERKILADLHTKTAQFAHDILKMSMPDADARKSSIIKNIMGSMPGLPGSPAATAGPSSSHFLSPKSSPKSSSRRGTLQMRAGPDSPSQSRRNSRLSMSSPSNTPSSSAIIDDHLSTINISNFEDPENGNSLEEQERLAEEEEIKESKIILEKSNSNLLKAKNFTRRMSVRPEELLKFNNNPKNFMKEGIESTENVIVEVHDDMEAMDLALASLKKYKQAEKEKKEKEQGLKTKEIEILVESQIYMQKQVEAFKSDYISEDVEDVIQALKKRINILDNELHEAVRRNDIMEQFKLEENGGDGAGSLEALEHVMQKSVPIMKLRNSVVAKKLSVGTNLLKLNEELKLLKVKNGTEKQVSGERSDCEGSEYNPT